MALKNGFLGSGDFEFEGLNPGVGAGFTIGGVPNNVTYKLSLDNSTAATGSKSQRVDIMGSTAAGSTAINLYNLAQVQASSANYAAQFTVGDTVIMGVSLLVPVALTNATYYLRAEALDNSGNPINHWDIFPAASTAVTTWTNQTASFTIPANTVNISLALYVNITAANAFGTIWVDNATATNTQTVNIPVTNARSIKTALYGLDFGASALIQAASNSVDWSQIATNFDLVVLPPHQSQGVRALKTYYPGIQCYAYTPGPMIDLNSQRSGFPFDQANMVGPHPDWFLYNASGIMNSPNFSNEYWADPNNQAFCREWVGAVLQQIKNAPWDGIFLDVFGYHFLWQASGYSFKYANDAAWGVALLNFLKAVYPDIHAAGYKLMGNTGSSDLSTSPMTTWTNYIDGFFEEGEFLNPTVGTYVGQTLWTSQIANQTSAGNKIVVQQARVTLASDQANRWFALGSYLLAKDTAGVNTYLAAALNNYSSTSFQFHTDFNCAIGIPQGAIVNVGSGLYTRQYSKGFVAVNGDASNPHNATVPNDGNTYTDLGNTVRSGTVSVAAQSAMICTHP